MKALVIGCGSIGERHIKNLIDMGIKDIIAYDIIEEKTKEIKQKYGIETHKELDDALKEKPDAVLVCTPTNIHIPTALKAIDNNCHVFIEKPISHNLDGIDELIKKAEEKNLAIMTGYNLRFHPGLKLVKNLLDKGKIGRPLTARVEYGQYMPDWRPEQDYRKVYSAKRDMGGGIVLDASHEIDYIRWLFGDVKNILAFVNKLSKLDIDVEDTADAIIRTENGSIIALHLDALNRIYTRFCKIVGEKGTIIWDYADKTVKLYEENKEPKTFKFDIDMNDVYKDELKYFLECIRSGKKPEPDGNDGKRVLEIAIAIKKSSGKIEEL